MFLKRLILLLLACACARREPHPPVIVISIDTLRADHVSARATPHIDALARDGIVFRNAWSHSPLTLPSHLSMFTGLLPPEHGVRDNAGYRFDATAHPTLAAVLRGERLSDGRGGVGVCAPRGDGRGGGVREYDDAIGIVDGAPVGALQRSGDVTEKIAERWIAAQEREAVLLFSASVRAAYAVHADVRRRRRARGCDRREVPRFSEARAVCTIAR